MQRDWARKETNKAIKDIICKHYGSYGLGIDYAETHIPRQPQRGAYSRLSASG